MTTPTLPHTLERTIHIGAPIAVVFRYFTDNERWAAWWGAGSTIDPTPGGHVLIRNPGGVEVTGEVVALEAPTSMTFTYGYASGSPIPPGASRVSIRLDEDGDGTRLHLTHAFAAASARDAHVQGWRYQLSVFANVVTDTLHASAEAIVDRWLATWSEPDEAIRDATLAGLVSPAITVRDRFTLVAGLEDLRPHLAAVHRFMPGIRLAREGASRHCQGMVLADWVARSADGTARGTGTSVLELDAAGRITRVTGFWSLRA